MFLIYLFLIIFKTKIAMETKNYFITLLLSLFCIPMNAQLKVLSNGKVGIGTTNPQYGFLELESLV